MFYFIVVLKGPKKDAVCTSTGGVRHIPPQTKKKTAFVCLFVVCKLDNSDKKDQQMPLVKVEKKNLCLPFP